MTEGNLEVKLPIYGHMHQQWWEQRTSQRKEDESAQKIRNASKHRVFSMLCGPGRSKDRLAQATGAETSERSRISLGALLEDVETVGAIEARSTFRSQNIQKNLLESHMLNKWEKVHAVDWNTVKCTPWREEARILHCEVRVKADSGHSWTLRCRKSIRRCGAKHISESTFFGGRRNTWDRWTGKNAKAHWNEAVSSAVNLPFCKDVSQNCFVFDYVTSTFEGCLA